MGKRKFVLPSEPVRSWWSNVYCPGGWSGHSGFPDDELSSEEGVAKTVYELSECDDDIVTLNPCNSGDAFPSEPSAGQGPSTDQAGTGISSLEFNKQFNVHVSWQIIMLLWHFCGLQLCAGDRRHQCSGQPPG